MKKLMLAFAAAAVAVCAQAASVDWSVANKSVKDADNNALGGATYYLVNATAWDQTAVLAALAAGEITASNISEQTFYLDQGVGNTATKTIGGMAKKTATSASITEGSYVDLAYIMFAEDKYFVSGTAQGLVYDPTGSIETEGRPAALDATSFSASISGGWQTAGAVPEPTSGLLLLLGMAGLALKRKHA